MSVMKVALRGISPYRKDRRLCNVTDASKVNDNSLVETYGRGSCEWNSTRFGHWERK